jgi:hypothetical protein
MALLLLTAGAMAAISYPTARTRLSSFGTLERCHPLLSCQYLFFSIKIVLALYLSLNSMILLSLSLLFSFTSFSLILLGTVQFDPTSRQLGLQINGVSAESTAHEAPA